jgi:hypothetical protein
MTVKVEQESHRNTEDNFKSLLTAANKQVLSVMIFCSILPTLFATGLVNFFRMPRPYC